MIQSEDCLVVQDTIFNMCCIALIHIIIRIFAMRNTGANKPSVV